MGQDTETDGSSFMDELHAAMGDDNVSTQAAQADASNQEARAQAIAEGMDEQEAALIYPDITPENMYSSN
jgi:hypothetical protein